MRFVILILILLVSSVSGAGEWTNDCDDAGVANVFEDDGAGGDTLDAACLESLKTSVKDNDDRTAALEAIDTVAEIETAETVNIILATEIDTAAEFAAIMTQTIGTGSIVRASSPTLITPEIGAATATTPAADDNDTSVATTAYVQGEINEKSAATSTDNAVARFDSTAGDVQDSGCTVSDTDVLTCPGGFSTGASGVGCLMIRDTDDAGWSECTTLNGAIACTTDADGVCDGT